MIIGEIIAGIPPGFTLYALFVSDEYPVLKFFKETDDNSQRQLFSLFNQISQTGLPQNETKFRTIGNDIYEFKARNGARILCFFGGPSLQRSLILTHGFKKPRQNILKRERQKAMDLKEQFFNEYDNIEIRDIGDN